MDKSKIILFSDTIRNKLYKEVKGKASYFGILPNKILDVDQEFVDSIVINGKVFNKKIKEQRKELIRKINDEGYEQLIDE